MFIWVSLECSAYVKQVGAECLGHHDLHKHENFVSENFEIPDAVNVSYRSSLHINN